MKRLKISGILEYDDLTWHGGDADQEAKDWFFGVLGDGEYVTVFSHYVEEEIGPLQVTDAEVVTEEMTVKSSETQVSEAAKDDADRGVVPDLDGRRGRFSEVPDAKQAYLEYCRRNHITSVYAAINQAIEEGARYLKYEANLPPEVWDEIQRMGYSTDVLPITVSDVNQTYLISWA